MAPESSSFSSLLNALNGYQCGDTDMEVTVTVMVMVMVRAYALIRATHQIRLRP